MDSFNIKYCVKENGFLKNKAQLIQHFNNMKKGGYLFFQENLDELGIETPFELYYFLCKGNFPYRNAFPMPINVYRNFKVSLDSIKLLNMYYRHYYQELSLLPFNWSGWEFHEGERFVWVYRKLTM